MSEDPVSWALSRFPARADMCAPLMRMELALRKSNFHSMSAWWREQLNAFYASGKRRLVLRVGRRGGKSSTLCRVAVNECLYGRFDIPSGDRGVFAFVSVSRREATDRLHTIKEILDILGVGYEATAEELRIQHRPIIIRVYTANARTAVGFTCIGLVADEVARWRDEEGTSNPATEVLRTLRPSMATQKNAHEFLSSSPWSTLDAHHEHFGQGDNAMQMCVSAPTWVANPSIDEDKCRQLEPDEGTFNREYGAEPMSAGESTFFDATAIDAAVGSYSLPRLPCPGDEVIAAADFGFQRDSSALVICHKNGDRYSLADMHELTPNGKALRPGDTVQQFSEVLQRHGVSALMADGHYRQSIIEHLEKNCLGFIDAPTDVASTYVRARTLFHQGLVSIVDDRRLVRDLYEVRSAPTPTGRVRIILPKRAGGGHADRVSALILALWQRAGKTCQEVVRPPDGWTQEELQDMKDDRWARRAHEDEIDMGDWSIFDAT